MPTKQRRLRSEQLKKLREIEANELRNIDQSVTPSIKSRITNRKNSGNLTEAIVNGCEKYKFVGVTFDNNGQPAVSPRRGQGGNTLRAEEKKDRIQEFKAKYSNLWRTRHGAKKIAQQTGYSIETIRRYFREDKAK